VLKSSLRNATVSGKNEEDEENENIESKTLNQKR
jgi:hypothetical protein